MLKTLRRLVSKALFPSARLVLQGGSLTRRGTVFKGGPGRVYTSVAVTCTHVLSRAGVSEPNLISLRNATRITPSDGQGGNNLFRGVKC
jgi:hypothetical protein